MQKNRGYGGGQGGKATLEVPHLHEGLKRERLGTG
jgi:hypothetical protein